MSDRNKKWMSVLLAAFRMMRSAGPAPAARAVSGREAAHAAVRAPSSGFSSTFPPMR